MSAPIDLIAYRNRGYKSLQDLAAHAQRATQDHGRDKSTMGFLQLDNVQNYHRKRDQLMGSMNIGMAATYCEIEGINLAASDLMDKRRRIAENKRASLSVEQLLTMLDQKHLNTVYSLHWLQILVNYIPELSTEKPKVSELFRQHAIKLQLPGTATKVHPLASSGKNATVITEFKDALVDFLGQMGQTEKDNTSQIILAGGDGLTYQKMLDLKRYLQFHPDPFQSFELLEPILSPWHTEWTGLSRIFEAHWDSLVSTDPSTLGHSAAQIGRPAPSTLNKVDYYPAAELTYLVLDVRVLDCWRNHFECKDLFEYFSQMAAAKTLPTIDQLYLIAKNLHLAFSSTNGAYRALYDTSVESTTWARTVRLGSAWTPPPTFSSSQPQPPGAQTKKAKVDSDFPDTKGRHAKGDRVLANSIIFMRDAILSREMSYATAEGDAGRVYEVMKMMLFMFAGSSHSKYATYLLETISNLELESSSELREAILRSTLVNLTGRPGAFTAADMMQEYFNRLLGAIAEKKGIEYGSTFLRNVISPNIHHFARITLDLRDGIGLQKHNTSHTAPHLKPELYILLKTYSSCELHFRRPGRVVNEVDRDDFAHGITKLREGKLKKWIFETTSTRALLHQKFLSNDELIQMYPDSDESDLEAADEEDDCVPNSTLGFTQVIDGELVFVQADEVLADIDRMITGIDTMGDVDGDVHMDINMD